MGRSVVLPVEPCRTAAVAIPDERFRHLMGADRWQALHPAVRARFGRKLIGAASLVYKGIVTQTRLSRAGWLLAQACRVIGAPLPLDHGKRNMPAIVTVTEDIAAGGQFWTRCYGRGRGFPQVIHSSKRFEGRTGLEEYIGCGIGMSLDVTAEQGAMVFTSTGYHLRVAGRRIGLPAWLMPGTTVVRHIDLGDGNFAFDLSVRHRLLGELVHQSAVFAEAEVVPAEMIDG